MPDTTPPIITLIGADIIAVETGEVYVDPGFMVTDDVTTPENIYTATQFTTPSNEYSAILDTTIQGAWLVAYSAQDEEGNWSYANRTVIVAYLVDPLIITLLGPSSVILSQLEEFYYGCGATHNGGYGCEGISVTFFKDGISVPYILRTNPGVYEIRYNAWSYFGIYADEVIETATVIDKTIVDAEASIDGSSWANATARIKIIVPSKSSIVCLSQVEATALVTEIVNSNALIECSSTVTAASTVAEITIVTAKSSIVCLSQVEATSVVALLAKCPIDCQSTFRVTAIVSVWSEVSIACTSQLQVTPTSGIPINWKEFNQGLIIGMQLSDKPVKGYNIGDHIKLVDISYNPGNHTWTILR